MMFEKEIFFDHSFYTLPLGDFKFQSHTTVDGYIILRMGLWVLSDDETHDQAEI